MFMAFIIILFVIVLSKCNSCSKDKSELQEEPISLIANIERMTNTTLLSERDHLSVNYIWQLYDGYCSVYLLQTGE